MRPSTTKTILASLIAVSIGLLSGCATNGKISAIFFPKERATKAADNVIDEIFGATPAPAEVKTENTKK